MQGHTSRRELWTAVSKSSRSLKGKTGGQSRWSSRVGVWRILCLVLCCVEGRQPFDDFSGGVVHSLCRSSLSSSLWIWRGWVLLHMYIVWRHDSLSVWLLRLCGLQGGCGAVFRFLLFLLFSIERLAEHSVAVHRLPEDLGVCSTTNAVYVSVESKVLPPPLSCWWWT